MYSLVLSHAFLLDAKRLKRKHYGMEKLYSVLHDPEAYDLGELRRQYRDHQLEGPLGRYREPHVPSGWPPAYRIDGSLPQPIPMRTGSHDGLLG